MFDLSLLVLSSLLMAATPQREEGASVHVVRKGDTLWDLARARGCSVEQVRKANKLEPGELRVGRLSAPRHARRALETS